MIRKLLGAFAPLLFAACATTSTTSTVAPAPKYQLNLSGSIDGVAFQRTGVGSAATTHQMTINSTIAVNYFTVQSCHRSVDFPDVIPADPWYVWGKDNKSFSWEYDESPTIEDSGDCILRFCAFSKVVGSPPSACAVVDFKSSKYTLPGENICNGAACKETGGHCTTSGTAICHSQVGLIQRYQFSGPVVIAPQQVDATSKAPYWITNQCQGTFIDDNNTLFEYRVPEAECVTTFMETKYPYRRAKLTVITYDTALYPGAQ